MGRPATPLTSKRAPVVGDIEDDAALDLALRLEDDLAHLFDAAPRCLTLLGHVTCLDKTKIMRGYILYLD